MTQPQFDPRQRQGLSAADVTYLHRMLVEKSTAEGWTDAGLSAFAGLQAESRMRKLRADNGVTDECFQCSNPVTTDGWLLCDACHAKLPEQLCASCGKPADLALSDGSTWCIACDASARNLGYDNAHATLLGEQ